MAKPKKGETMEKITKEQYEDIEQQRIEIEKKISELRSQEPISTFVCEICGEHFIDKDKYSNWCICDECKGKRVRYVRIIPPSEKRVKEHKENLENCQRGEYNDFMEFDFVVEYGNGEEVKWDHDLLWFTTKGNKRFLLKIDFKDGVRIFSDSPITAKKGGRYGEFEIDIDYNP